VDNTSVSVIGIVQEGARKGKLDSAKLYDGSEVAPLLEASSEGNEAEAGTENESMEVES